MSLRDEMEAAMTRRGPVCSVVAALEVLGPELAEILAEPQWENAAIEKVCRSHGLKVLAAAISRHRRGICACH